MHKLATFDLIHWSRCPNVFIFSLQGLILVYLATKTPPEKVDAHGNSIFTPALNAVLSYAPAFKDFLQRCLCNTASSSAFELLNHPFIKEPINYAPPPGAPSEPHLGHSLANNSGESWRERSASLEWRYNTLLIGSRSC